MSLYRRIAAGVALGSAFLAAGCSSTLDGPLSSNYTESASVALVTGFGPAVQGDLKIANTSGSSQDIAWAQDCGLNAGVEMRAYRQVGGQSVLAWDSSRLPQLGCASTLIHTTIAPGDTFTFEATYLVDQILGDSLPVGEYRITLTSTLTTPVLPTELTAGALALDNTPVVPPGTDLNGTWTGASQGVSVSLALTWTADSVSGSGSYTVSATTELGCGFFGLRGTSGTVTLAAARRGDFIGGVMLFSGEGPGYSGMLTSASHLSGQFMAVDTPGCQFDLARGP